MRSRSNRAGAERRRAPIAAALVISLLAAGIVPVEGASEPKPLNEGNPATSRAPDPPVSDSPPNIVVIMTDDQTVATMTEKFMPWTEKLLVGPGTVFQNFVVTTPICCPSRAGFYTGQYAHNNGVFQNKPGYGGLDEKENVLPAWLREAGYKTALVGKFMHGYEDAAETPLTPAPGYTDWYALLANSYYRYGVSDNGDRIWFGRHPNDYATTVINRRAVELIRTYAKSDEPFFIHVAHIAPHSHRTKGSICDHTAQPAPRDIRRYSRAVFPSPPPPAFDEADVFDKPSFIQTLRNLTAKDRRELRLRYRCRAASLREVDRGVRRTVQVLKRTGELAKTVIVLTGDNGYFVGEHRIRRGKGLPYEEAIAQPLVMRVPSRYRGEGPLVQTVPEAVANIDLAPTLLDLAKADPCPPEGDCRTLDGRSLMPLLEGGRGGFARRGVLIEYRAPRGLGGRKAEGGTCVYGAIRTAKALYAEYTQVQSSPGACVPTMEVEHYDLDTDPFELANLFPPASPTIGQQQTEFAARLEVLRRCSGTSASEVPGSPDCE